MPMSIIKNKPTDNAIRIDKNLTVRFDWPLSLTMEYKAPPKLARIRVNRARIMNFISVSTFAILSGNQYNVTAQ